MVNGQRKLPRLPANLNALRGVAIHPRAAIGRNPSVPVVHQRAALYHHLCRTIRRTLHLPFGMGEVIHRHLCVAGLRVTVGMTAQRHLHPTGAAIHLRIVRGRHLGRPPDPERRRPGDSALQVPVSRDQQAGLAARLGWPASSKLSGGCRVLGPPCLTGRPKEDNQLFPRHRFARGCIPVPCRPAVAAAERAG